MVFSLWQNFKLKFYTICTFQTVRPEECRWRNLESEMGKKDLTDMLGGGGGRTRQKYKCKAVGCQVTPTLKKSKYVWKLTWYADFQVLVCRYWILGMQIWLFQNTTYSNKILVKRLSIQIWISGAFYLPLTTTTCVMLHASGCSGVRLPCRSPSPLSSWTFSTSLMIFISSQFEKSWF